MKKNYFPNFRKVVENNFSGPANFFQKSAAPNIDSFLALL